MTRTRRIYNRKIKKCHRVDLQTSAPQDLKKLVETGEINNPLKFAVHQYGFAYHPYHRLCMGKCPCCRDHTKDQRHQRKIRKRDFVRFVSMELNEWIQKKEI